METSQVAKIIRCRIFLQNFDFMIRHISGPANKVADWLSRLTFIESDTFPKSLESDIKTYLFIASSVIDDSKHTPNSLLTAHEAFLVVHNS
jgi:hypothetical protein